MVYMALTDEVDITLVHLMLLGSTFSLLMNYRNLIHAPDSKDVVAATFRDADRKCYRLVPYTVPC